MRTNDANTCNVSITAASGLLPKVGWLTSTPMTSLKIRVKTMWWQLALVLLVASCNNQRARPQPALAAEKEKQPAVILLGPIERSTLGGDPYRIWFDEQYGGYQLDTLTLAPLAESLVDVDIKIFLGTWCQDSRREVPRV